MNEELDLIKLNIYEAFENGEITYGEKEYLLEQVDILYEYGDNRPITGGKWSHKKQPTEEDRRIAGHNRDMRQKAQNSGETENFLNSKDLEKLDPHTQAYLRKYYGK